MTDFYEEDLVPVPRHRVFVLSDGSFVVQWEASRVQDLLSGRYYPYQSQQYGNPIGDWELNQLKAKGIVQDYDTELVLLSPLPNIILPANSTRAFYINTGLPKTDQRALENMLKEHGFHERFAVRSQDYYLIVRGSQGVAFADFDEAERARQVLLARFPEVFAQSVVAFVEVTNRQ